MTVIEADLTWIGDRFEPGVKIAINELGQITTVGAIDDPVTLRLRDRALVPGFVNAHSHAFQRALRGLGESFPSGHGSFWTWREAMYDLVERLDPDRFATICTQAFREMLFAGITTVGEFHYFHHTPQTTDYAYDRLCLRAAHDAGIRIVLLNTYYETGGIGRKPSTAQLRFYTKSAESYWQHLDQLQRNLLDRQHLGVAAHSIRAVPIETIRSLHTEATRRGLTFHIHLEEQRQEIADCRAAYGTTPMNLLSRELESPGNLTAVHCTHSTPADIDAFLDAERSVCICPTTEANLGDGIPCGAAVGAAARISLGTDSNARISMAEEMRWLEYGQRLRYESRGRISDSGGEVAGRLMNIATIGGASSLGINAGIIEAGACADFVSIDLNHPDLAFSDATSLAAAFVFGGDSSVIDDVCVGGVWRGLTERSGT